MTDDLRNLPEPLVPADVDLTGLGFMPMQLRILTSTLFAKSTGDEFKAAFALWCASWHERPAATLPDDPVMLAFLSRVDAETWARVSPVSLHGWTKRSDGRLHHEVLASLALAAWEKRGEYREEKENRETRQKRWRDKLKRLTTLLRERGHPAPRHASLEKLVEMCTSHVPGFLASTVDGDTVYTVDGGEIGKRETGTVRETGTARARETGTERVVGGIAKTGAKPAAKAPRKRAADTDETRGKRLAKDWKLPQPWGQWALEKYPHWSAEIVREIATKFRNHWVALSSKDAAKLDWYATWQNWCMSGITQREHPPPRGPNGRKPTQASLDQTNREADRLLFGDDPQPGQPPADDETGALGHG